MEETKKKSFKQVDSYCYGGFVSFPDLCSYQQNREQKRLLIFFYRHFGSYNLPLHKNTEINPISLMCSVPRVSNKPCATALAHPCTSWPDVSFRFPNGRCEQQCFEFCLTQSQVPCHSNSSFPLFRLCVNTAPVMHTEPTLKPPKFISSSAAHSFDCFNWRMAHTKKIVYFSLFTATLVDFEKFKNVYD